MAVMSDLVGISISHEDTVIASPRWNWAVLWEGNGDIVLVSSVAILLVIVTQMHLYGRRKNLPPGPRPWPIIGSLHLLGMHPYKPLAELARTYGPVMSVQLGQKLCVVATSPEAAMDFLKHQDANFSSRPYMRAAELILPKDVAFMSTSTPVHRHLKKIVVSELTSPKPLEASKYIRAEEVAYMVRTISQETGPIKVKTYLNIMSSNILSRMILSKRFLGAAGDTNVSEIQEYIEIVEDIPRCYGALHLQDVFNFVPRWFG